MDCLGGNLLGLGVLMMTIMVSLPDALAFKDCTWESNFEKWMWKQWAMSRVSMYITHLLLQER